MFKFLKIKDKPDLVSIIIILLILCFLIRFQTYQIGINLTESLPQKIFLVKKGTLPKRNNYVVFYKPNKWYKNSFVKQVIGVEGDEIKIEANKVLIIVQVNAKKKIIDAGIVKEFSLRGEKLTKINAGIIPAGYYFVHATHKDSLDSRYSDIGLISVREIIGVATSLNGYCLLVLLLIPSCFLIVRFRKKSLVIAAIFLLSFILFLLCLSSNSIAKDLGVQGKIYPIIETDLAANIKHKLKSWEKSGKLAKLQKQWQEKTIASTKRPKPVEGLYKAKETKEFIFDPSIQLRQDIVDHQGNLIAAKGKRINPLDYKSLPEHLLFIDGDDREQLKWAKDKAKKHQSMIILTRGNIIDLMKSEKIRLYFDQGGFLVKTFGITALPTIVYQDAKMLKVRQEVVR
jgi:conjugal transfer pilus assembly protein TraW